MKIHEEPTEVRKGETHYNMKSDTWDTKPLLEVSCEIKKMLMSGRHLDANM